MVTKKVFSKITLIHTDSDFSLFLDDEKLEQFKETVYINIEEEDDLIEAILTKRLKSDKDKGRDLLDMFVEYGEGCYGNYSIFLVDSISIYTI